MKNKYKYLSFILLTGMTFTSCEDYLDTESKSSYTEKVVFANPSLAEDAVINIYSYFGQTNSHRSRYMPYYGMNTDVEYYNDLANPTSDEKTSLCTYSAFVSNGWMGSGSSYNAYTCFFNGIEAANCCIEGIRQYGKPETNETMAYLLGEALTLRAHYYYDLIRAWGDVPARFEPVTESTVYLPKSDRDIIYKQIIADLKEAAGYLPWPGATTRTSTTERVNKAYALGLRARLILMASGYSLRPSSLDDANSSEVRKSTDTELTGNALLQEAYDDLKNILANSGCSLNATYESVWNELCQDVVTSNRESIFEIPFAAGRGRFLYHFGLYHHTTSDHLSKTKYGGQNCPAPTLFYEYDVKDTRRDLNCTPYKWNNGGYTMDNLGSGAGNPSFNFGKYDYERMNRVVTSNDDGVNLPVLRFADVLLMAAEVANELEGANAAKTYLKQIRERAFKQTDWAEHVTVYLNNISSKEQMLQAIQKERMLEFPGEMLRKQDLIRWNLLGSSVKETVEKMNALRNRTGEYADVPTNVYTRTINGKLEVYGLNRGELSMPSGDGWAKLSYDFITSVIKDNLLNNYYINEPDQRQYWPLFQTDLDSSNGYLINNYGYK
nr:RagB/SusD family nutrient uptake outer membrane protein [uncultured Bacteroides sp.]